MKALLCLLVKNFGNVQNVYYLVAICPIKGQNVFA